MKRKLRGILALCLMLSVLFLTSCGFFGSSTLEIVDMRVEPQEDGSNILVVELADGTLLEIVVPEKSEAGKDGEDGAEGRGIENITGIPGETETTVEILYTDGETVSFTVPNGLSVVEVWPDEDEIGQYFYLEYSDGTTSKNLYLPSGKDGDTIVEIETPEPNADLSRVFTVVMGSGKRYDLPIPPPLQGVGIKSVTGGEADGKYYLTITDTDGVELPPIEVPLPNRWYSSTEGTEVELQGVKEGDYLYDRSTNTIYIYENNDWQLMISLEPNRWYSHEYGIKATFDNVKEGDFLYDTTKNIIYIYEDGDWSTLITFSDMMDTYAVTFVMPDGAKQTVDNIPRGSYIADKIPNLSKEGYKFLGWYTAQEVDPAIMSPFTDLTPVFSNLKLYAVFEPIS